MPTPKRRPTMNDVARAAGVSQSLVSIVFRNAPGASESTRKKVFAAAERLGYLRDQRAALLRASVSTDIGVYFELNHPFHHMLLDGLYEANASLGYHLFLSPKSEKRDEEQAISELIHYRCGALILLGSQLSPAELHALNQKLPTILLARQLPPDNTQSSTPWVCSDDEGAMRKAVTYLIAKGHRQLCYVKSPGSAANEERKHGFLAAMAEQLPGVKPHLITGGASEHEGAQCVGELLQLSPAPSAVIGFNDYCAKGIIEQLLQQGYKVPQDYSVMGFDDSAVARLPYLQLTTMAQDGSKLAQLALELAIQKIKGQRLIGMPDNFSIPMTLREGQTVAPI